ncbi:MAG: N-acetylmuramic acid 6-phosphate etherase [Lachnospiraceae bacterium]
MNLEALMTEQRNKKTMQMDDMSIRQIIEVMNEEDMYVVHAVKKAIPQIESLIGCAVKALSSSGRIIYVGAGTSGRLGILDAVECPPTFGVSYDTVVGVIAGGDNAFVKAKEGAEDSVEEGAEDLKKINLTEKDLVIGLTASGRTPYAIGAVKYARDMGCVTGAISCNPNAEISAYVDAAVELETGPEIISGSTRLKAGTAEKMVLNMISSISMIRMGKTYKNFMVDLKSTNYKLEQRAINIVMKAAECSKEQAENALKASGRDTKIAIVMLKKGCTCIEAENRLLEAKGRVGEALQN